MQEGREGMSPPEQEKQPLKLRIVNPELPQNQDTEVRAALDWTKERIGLLSKMEVTAAPVTDGEKWKSESAENGEVNRIRGAHFTVEGRKIQTPAFGWEQPLINQAGQKAVDAETGNEIEVSGLIIQVRKPDGSVLLGVQQEPGMPAVKNANGEEVHPALRNPVQTSVVKLDALTQGEREKDPMLFDLLQGLAETKGKNIGEVISEIPVAPVHTDGNRLETHNFYGVLEVDDATAQRLEDKLPTARFFNEKQVDALKTTGLINGHTLSSLSIAPALLEQGSE